MEYYQKAKELLDMDAVDFTGAVTIDQIKEAEKELKMLLPALFA